MTKDSALESLLQANHLVPLWEIFSSVVPPLPQPSCEPMLWKFEHLRPLLLEMGEKISAREAERRVLILNNPGTEGYSATRSLYAGLQLLKPGETADRHRHTQAALRFVIEGAGAYTTVQGERIEMCQGDLLLTPSGAWHDHGMEHSAPAPMIWLDGIDLPIVSFFDSTFFQAGPAANQTDVQEQIQGDTPHQLAATGKSNTDWPTTGAPMLKFPYEPARARLCLAQAKGLDLHHGTKMQYAGQQSDTRLFATISCYLQHLPNAFKSLPYRATDASINLVVEGAGRIYIGEPDQPEASSLQCFSFQPNDIFVLPNWTWYHYEADTDAVIFSYSDHAAQQSLGLWREEKAYR